MNNSNQTGVLIIMAIVLCAIGSFFAFFGSEMENQNLSSSYGQLSPSSSKNLFSNHLSAVDISSDKETRNELSGITLPVSKRSVSADNSSQTSEPNFPSTGMKQTNVAQTRQTSVASRTSNSGGAQSSAYAISNTNFQKMANASESNVNGMFLPNIGQGASPTDVKRVNLALNGKTVSSSSDAQGGKVQKVDGNPYEPGGSLPIGDGVWIMLSLLGVYGLFGANKGNSLAKMIGLMR